MPQTQYGPGKDLEAELRRYILRQFSVFVREACKLGHKGIWHVDQIEKEALEFLRLSTIHATYSKGYDKSGRTFGQDWTDNWGGHIQPEIKRHFEASGEWQQFKDALLQVADSQAERAPDIRGDMVEEIGEISTDPAQSARTGGTDADGVLSNRTPLGGNLDRLRRECGWSFDEMAVATGFEKKLILGHIRKGKNAYPSTLATYAHTFTKKLGRPVSVAELEG